MERARVCTERLIPPGSAEAMEHCDRPVLIAMKGHPGTGKSTVARMLGRRLGAPVIAKDDIKDVLHEQADDAGGLAYRAMFRVARRQLLQGLSVICDSPLSEAEGYALARSVAREGEARLAVVECVCSSEGVWRRRIEGRGTLRLPGHHITSWPALQRHLERRAAASAYPLDAPHLLVDTVAPLEQLVERVMAWLSEGPGRSAGCGGGPGSPAG
jgi:predicted kinase